MTIRKAITTIRRDIRYFGIVCTIYDVLLRLLNRLVFLKVLRVIALPAVPFEQNLPRQYRFGCIPAAELTMLSRNPEYSMNPVLLQEMKRGDNACFGIYDGQAVANYLFIFVTPVRMNDELEVSFGPRYAYLCAAFTHPLYRCLHMNSIASGLADREYLNRGFHELLAYVESNNFSSLRSFARIGWRTIGTIHIFRIFGRYYIHTSAGCDAYSFRVIPIEDSGRNPNSDQTPTHFGDSAKRQIS
jgi:hypothetical protein